MADTDSSVVRTHKLTKIFRDFWLREKVTAVSELDLDVMGREVFGLLGPNGSGKSTTLKMILGLLFPTRGVVTVFGRRATDVRVKSRIGFLPEESYLYPFLDAHETLGFYGRLFKQPRRQRLRRIEMLLDMVGLTSVAYRRVGEYSKGMQRRIGLAQALINDPDLLILDEPTTGMDPIGTRQIKDLIRTLAQRGKTVLLSSHLLADVEDVCDRVCILYGGMVRQLGDVDSLLAKRGLTQITTDHLDGAALERVRGVLAEGGKEIRDVSAPRDTLESMFLRIVEEARAGRVKTGGAVAGGAVADFLRTGADGPAEGAQVVQQLVAAAKVDSAPDHQQPEAPVAAQPPRPSAAVLGELMEAGKSGADAPAPAAARDEADGSPHEPADQPQADRSIIDGLLGGDDREGR